VNAAGPWVSRFLQEATRTDSRSRIRLVKGSHIVVPRLYDGDHAYILQNDDRRVVFVVPFEDDFSLIGTTDVPVGDDPLQETITDEELDYLLRAVGRYLAHPPGRSDIVWSYAGVRPLYDDRSRDPSTVTRDYVFDLEAPEGRAPLLSVFGGKLTTYRRLAEHALAKLSRVIPVPGGPWTAGAPLPGGDIPDADFDGFLDRLRAERPGFPEPLLRRLARAYGTRVDRVLRAAERPEELGRDFGAGLSECELEHLVREEWARTTEDVLWRRSKLGLRLGRREAEAVGLWIAQACERAV
jgi:glycerol-3-phosphate dehydrogenase